MTMHLLLKRRLRVYYDFCSDCGELKDKKASVRKSVSSVMINAFCVASDLYGD